jgi:hypothetical protein
MKWILFHASLLGVVLSLGAVPAVAQVRIAAAHRLHNPREGYCTWCALETIGRHLGIDDLRGLVDWYRRQPSAGAGADDVKVQLDELGVCYEMRRPGPRRDLDFVRQALDSGLPVLISFRGWPSPRGAHAVVLTRLDDQGATFIDSNHPDYDYQVSLGWFQHYWDGWAVVVRPQPSRANSTE